MPDLGTGVTLRSRRWSSRPGNDTDSGVSQALPETVLPVAVGILGCSDIARRKFLPALRDSTNARLAAVASRTREKAESFASGERCDVFSYGELTAAAGIDLIYISLPNHLHEKWTIRALQEGKHVICEKPLGLSRSSVERMLAVAEEEGRLLYENLMYLHHPQHAIVKDLVLSGEIGEIITLRAAFGFPSPGPGNFRLDPSRGGGAFHDLARYPLSTARYFLRGERYDFHCFTSHKDRLDVGMHGLARTECDETFTFSFGFGQQYESYYEIVGEKGMVRVDRAYTTPPEMANRVAVMTGGEDASFLVPPYDHFRLMIDDVCAMIRGCAGFGALHAETRALAALADRVKRGCEYAGSR